MLTVSANTRHRVAIEDLGEVAVKGNPATVSVTRLSDGETVTWSYDSENETYETFPAISCPDFFVLEWEINSIKVQAQLELVATQYCELDEIRAYRKDEYQLTDVSDELVYAARASAVEGIEEACHRYFVPVVREALIERTNCTMAKYPVMLEGFANDLRSVIRSTYAETGVNVQVKVASKAIVDVSKVKPLAPVDAVLELGVGYIPQEVHDAVMALAAYRLIPKVGPENATSQSTDSGVLRFVTASISGAETSLPEVNAVINRWAIDDCFVR